MNTFELNNIRKDAEYFDNKFKKTSPICEVFSAMVDGKEIGNIPGADKSAKYIKELNSRAIDDDRKAISELNTLRKFVVETPLLNEMKLLSVFGTYKPLGFDETVEREVYKHVGEKSRIQAANGDVVFPSIEKIKYQVPTFMVSGGYEIDYRRAAVGDMTKENEGLAQVKIDIRNRAIKKIIEKVYKQYVDAEGVKYLVDDAGLTQTHADATLASIRRYGKPNVIGDAALLTQFTPWAGYVGTIASNTITGISEKQMNEIAETGLLGMYRGAILSEMPNPYDETTMNADGTDFVTMYPAGLGIIVPTGTQSPIMTWTKGGLTSMTGNDIHTGKLMTRFDLECAADLAKGLEYRIGLIHDQNLDDLA